MKKKILILSLGLAFAANSGFAQITNSGAFPVPEGYKAVSVNISANGQIAIVGIQKNDEFKYLYFKRQNGNFTAGNENNPLNALISKNIIPLNPSQSSDGNIVYFACEETYEDGTKNTDISYIEKINGVWSQKITLNKNVNTNLNEQYPAISPDGNTLYFTRLVDGGVDKRCGNLFFCNRLPGGEWEEAKDVPEPINLGCEASPYVCPDNKTIYISSIREGGKGGFDIYYVSRLNEKVWVIPIAADTINFAADEMSPTWDSQKKSLYLAFQDPKKKNNVTAAEGILPGNLSPTKATRYYGKTLDLVNNKPIGADITVTDVFSSEVLNKFKSDGITGEYDFFLSNTSSAFLDYSAPNYSHAIVETLPQDNEVKEDYKIFNKVSLQLNVFDSDMFEALSSDIVITADGQKTNIKPTEFSKGRYKMELPVGKNYEFTISKNMYMDYIFNMDLSQVVIFDSFERDAELVSDKSKVKFQVNGLAPNMTTEITITDISTESKFTTSVTTDENGNCDIMLRKGDTYKISIMAPGYTMFEKDINVPKVAKGEDILVIANITKLEEDVKIEIPNVNFETNSFTLDASSYEPLNKVVTLLKVNSQIEIELSAHTDDRGSDDYNNKLSDQRAASVAAYITSKGIDPARLVSKGYGKSQPLVPNNSDENRAKNRRVELKILSTNSKQ